ncbi:MAG TPA: glutamate 5-kinase [Bacteroidales bacterium]|mgnify:CR=1 FL=1|nr:glutamate 5-kinase [Bacteroidales bacterium]OQB60185.1 MAG: Glutamate 5-kinase [Bacteroidetes bacterium ADurb.Bin145]HOU03106.1 glutamate 5-kinase [Bacteroidales bacterium]HQG62924.1 glutamate 5-kinase [Bacteroidales bacterium]HQK66516.1 glutamate 5-kinase [Bacteroidales bacterium]
MKNLKAQFERIAIKIGSNVIAQSDGSLNTTRMLRLVEEIAILNKKGVEVILITSGAVAAGRNEMKPTRKTNIISAKQIWASIGQVKLMSTYQFLFGKYGIQAGQLLATKDSFRDRQHYLNMKNCITAMLENKVLPVVNENDTIAITELMFTDNDELSGMISSMMDCGSLIILTNVDGIYTGVPGCEGSVLIKEIGEDFNDPGQYISASRSEFGRGGMITKCSIAREIASEGINVYIANGTRDSIITSIVSGKDVPCTYFPASVTKKSGVKKWLSHSDTFAKGIVYINKGAKMALLGDKATSLLMIGVSRIEGFFKKGDIIRIFDEKGKQIGLGKAQYDSEKAVQYMGEKRKQPLVHYDYLLINEKNL